MFVDSATMKPVSDKEYSEAYPLPGGIRFAQLGHRLNFALLDRSGKEITGFIYRSPTRFTEGVGPVSPTLGKEILIDTTGKQIGEPHYLIGELVEGMIWIEDNNRFGFADKSMKIVIPVTYERAFSFSEGLARIKQGGKTGFINKEGKMIVQPIYDEAEDFRRGIAVVQIGSKKGFIDTKGNEICKIEYDRAINENSDYLVVGIKQSEDIFDVKYRYLDRAGKAVTPLIYDFAYSFRDGMGWVKVKDHLELIDKKGTKLATLDKYDDMYEISEGMTFLKVRKGLPDAGKIVPATAKGKEVGTEKYDGLKLKYKNGLAMVKKGDKYGFIDKAGKPITPFVLDYSEGFSLGFAKVKEGSYKYYIDTKGREYREK
jgi:hypothetical protein